MASRAALNLGVAGCLLLGFVDLGVLNLWLAPRALEPEGPGLQPLAGKVEPAARPDSGVVAPVAATSIDAAPRVAAVAAAEAGVQPGRPEVDPGRRASPVRSSVPRQLVLYFETASAVVGTDDTRSLQQLAAGLLGEPRLRVSVEGHADQRGSDAVNGRLSRQRAEAVRAVLLSLGVAAKRVRAAGLGSSRPVDLGDRPEGWQRNRRVEVRIK